MILHGIYDHGKIEIIEKDIPDIKTDVEIIMMENHSLTNQKRKEIAFGIIRQYDGVVKHWTRDELYVR